jgi:glucose/mannose-6-phosphate isomerase
VSAALDPPDPGLDRGGMAERIRDVPLQIEDALERFERSPWTIPGPAPSLLAVGAMGGSAIAANLCADLYADCLPHPLLAVRDYRWPAWAGPGSLALLASYSGNTEETLALYRDAGARGMARAVLTTGGTLAGWCERDGVPFLRLAAGSPPRAAMYGAWVALTGLLHALGWIEDPREGWRHVIVRLREQEGSLGLHVPERDNPAKRLARALAGRPVAIYAGARMLGAMATRFLQQLNENAKVPGHSALVPELNHNEIVGWEKPGAALRGSAVLILRDSEDDPPVRARLDLTAEYVERQGAAVHTIQSGEGERLVRFAQLARFGDYLSLYLAFVNGVDPTPIASIDAFKRQLAQRMSAPD